MWYVCIHGLLRDELQREPFEREVGRGLDRKAQILRDSPSSLQIKSLNLSPHLKGPEAGPMPR